MNKRMKIMIAYDGSVYADAAIDDLRNAELPAEGDATVVSVADISKTSITDSFDLGVTGKYFPTRLLEKTIDLAQKENADARSTAINLAIQGGKRVLSNLPGWRVRNQIALGNPAEELLKKAAKIKPDLIVLGSHGRSAIGRFFLGSVSQEVAEKAAHPVRVVRKDL